MYLYVYHILEKYVCVGGRGWNISLPFSFANRMITPRKISYAPVRCARPFALFVETMTRYGKKRALYKLANRDDYESIRPHFVRRYCGGGGGGCCHWLGWVMPTVMVIIYMYTCLYEKETQKKLSVLLSLRMQCWKRSQKRGVYAFAPQKNWQHRQKYGRTLKRMYTYSMVAQVRSLAVCEGRLCN